MEAFTLPAVGALITKKINNETYILLQERWKGIPEEDGLLEFPAGKIRAFESITDALIREVKEECGLDIIDIDSGKKDSFTAKNYNVQSFTPYYSVQNTAGNYPIMMDVFLCEAKGKLLTSSNESKNINWYNILEVKKWLDSPEKFYVMHFGAIKKRINQLLDPPND